MAHNNFNLLNIDVEKLFEEHKIEEIIEIEKLLDAEIERKRVDLRSMVGDRYKDVLAASDAIKNMKTISQDIVNNIQKITGVCEALSTNILEDEILPTLDNNRNFEEQRTLIVQIRLAIFMNEQIWIALDKEDNLTAAQFYLLAQHIHMGLNLFKKEFIDRLPLLKQIDANLKTLKNQIYHRINYKLESVKITAEETSSNLNALLLLKNQSTDDLLNIFIEHRKIALNTVINTSYSSVRAQISAMVWCLVTTVHLLHDCFMYYKDRNKGLIWQQLEDIVEDSSIPTLSKIQLPISPLLSYIPEVIKEFRPKYKIENGNQVFSEAAFNMGEWLELTKQLVKIGLNNSLKLVTNIKGLHMVREEALKIESPENWETICRQLNFPDNFNVWYYFFQDLMTERAKELISDKIASIIKNLENEVISILDDKSLSENAEIDLRYYIWNDDTLDISKTENKHTGLSMKTLGYSKNIVHICNKFDEKYLDVLTDVAQYLYGKEYHHYLDKFSISITDFKNKKKFVDRDELEKHLKIESTRLSLRIIDILQDLVISKTGSQYLVAKSLICVRLLQALTNLCSNFHQCCTFDGTTEDWRNLCNHFNQSSLLFWTKWIDKCVQNTDRLAKKSFEDIGLSKMISVFMKWDNTEIQEQAEERIFKSQIKVPLKPSLIICNILIKLNDDLSCILPQTLPRSIHVQFIERNIERIFKQYQDLSSQNLNQNQSLQFLFDVKFLTTFCIPRENATLILFSQDICDKLRAKIDPFDLDVFYSYLQGNVKRAIMQSQVLLGCLLPSSVQLANLGILEKNKEHEKEPSLLALSVPSIAFPMFCTFAHQTSTQKNIPPSDVQPNIQDYRSTTLQFETLDLLQDD